MIATNQDSLLVAANWIADPEFTDLEAENVRQEKAAALVVKDPRNPNLLPEVGPEARATPRGGHPPHHQEKLGKENTVAAVTNAMTGGGGMIATTETITAEMIGTTTGEEETTDIADNQQR